MTTEQRFERQLPAILEELYLGPSPDYRDEVLAAAVRTRQRPSWTFAGRWLPMADIASRSAIAPRVPWRTIGVALLIVALLLAVAVAYVGSHQTRVPAPFGVARNGLITYAADGDIYTTDTLTGKSAAIVPGPEGDSEPAFSPDGTRIAFQRTNINPNVPGRDIVVVGADGSNPVIITSTPIPSGSTHLEWSPDSRFVVSGAQDNSAIWMFDASRASEPRIVATNGDPYLRPFRPPDGSAILARRTTPDGVALLRIDLETRDETVLAEGGPDNDLGSARWSPDGSRVLYNTAPADDPESQRLFVVNADGTGTRQLTKAPGVWFDIDATWSPDGRRIAFTRYERVGSDWLVRPIGIYSVTDGSVIDAGPLPREARAQLPTPGDGVASAGEGYDFDWSPDGKTLIAIPGEAAAHPVLINADDGTWEQLAPVVEPVLVTQTWQRLAP